MGRRAKWLVAERELYKNLRGKMKPGDVVAFGGNHIISRIIKWRTGSPVSHVGVVLQTVRVGAQQEGFFNQIVESTNLDGFTGVSVSRISHRLAQYKGKVWWLPLRDDIRAALNADAFFDCLMEQVGKPYDAGQAILSAIDWLGWLTRNHEESSRLFCSELVALGFRAGGLFGDNSTLNPSEVTPADICSSWPLYEKCVQLKGPSETVPIVS